MVFYDFTAVFSGMGVVIGAAAVFIALWIIAISLKNGIGPVPTSFRVRSRVLALMPEQVEGTVVELGAGWGGMTLALACKYRNNQVVAVENSVPVWGVCWLRVKLSGCQNVEVRLGDIRQISFDGVGLIYCYLFQGAMKQLAKQLLERPSTEQCDQNRPSLLLISNTFALPSYTPEQILRADDIWRSCIYRYRLPAS